MNKQIKLGAVISYLSLVINIIISMIYIPWMVRTIGKSNYALYTLSISIISIFLMDFGLSAATTRFVAKYRAEQDQERINSFVAAVSKLYLNIGLLIAAALFVLYFFLDRIYVGLTPDELGTFKGLYIVVAGYSVASFPFIPITGILEAYEEFIQAKLCSLFNKILTVVIVIAMLTFGGNVTALVMANAVSGILTIILKVKLVSRHVSLKPPRRKVDRSLLSEVLTFSLWTTVMSIAQRCIFNLAPTILGMVSNSAEIAVFSPASTLEGYFYSFAAAVNGLFLATVSRYIAKNEEQKLAELMVKVGRYQFLVLGLIFVGFFCVGKEFIVLWMGEEFSKAWSCALLLFIPDILLFSQQIANTAVIAQNKVKQQAFGHIGMAVICLCLSFLLCGKLGAQGSAIAIATSYLFLFVYMNYLFKTQLRMDIIQFFKKCYLSLLPALLVSGVIGYLLSHYVITIGGWTGMIVKGAAICVVYAFTVYPALNAEERGMLSDVRMRWKSKRHSHKG